MTGIESGFALSLNEMLGMGLLAGMGKGRDILGHFRYFCAVDIHLG